MRLFPKPISRSTPPREARAAAALHREVALRERSAVDRQTASGRGALARDKVSVAQGSPPRSRAIATEIREALKGRHRTQRSSPPSVTRPAEQIRIMVVTSWWLTMKQSWCKG